MMHHVQRRVIMSLSRVAAARLDPGKPEPKNLNGSAAHNKAAGP